MRLHFRAKKEETDVQIFYNEKRLSGTSAEAFNGRSQRGSIDCGYSAGRNYLIALYLFDNTEESELLINDYRQKKAASRSVFYFMMILNLLAALVMKKMFHSSMYVNLATETFRFCIFLFYLLNAATLFLYEFWCSRNDKLE